MQIADGHTGLRFGRRGAPGAGRVAPRRGRGRRRGELRPGGPNADHAGGRAGRLRARRLRRLRRGHSMAPRCLRGRRRSGSGGRRDRERHRARVEERRPARREPLRAGRAGRAGCRSRRAPRTRGAPLELAAGRVQSRFARHRPQDDPATSIEVGHVGLGRRGDLEDDLEEWSLLERLGLVRVWPVTAWYKTTPIA